MDGNYPEIPLRQQSDMEREYDGHTKLEIRWSASSGHPFKQILVELMIHTSLAQFTMRIFPYKDTLDLKIGGKELA